MGGKKKKKVELSTHSPGTQHPLNLSMEEGKKKRHRRRITEGKTPLGKEKRGPYFLFIVRRRTNTASHANHEEVKERKTAYQRKRRLGTTDLHVGRRKKKP